MNELITSLVGKIQFFIFHVCCLFFAKDFCLETFSRRSPEFLTRVVQEELLRKHVHHCSIWLRSFNEMNRNSSWLSIQKTTAADVRLP